MGDYKTKDKKFYLILGITLVIMLGFGFLPPFGQITSAGMRILGIFLGLVFAWTLGELVWSSLSALILVSLFGFGTVNSNYGAAFGNGNMAVLMCGLVFCFAVSSCGLLKEVARWIISRRWAQKSHWGLIIGFYIAAMVIGALSTNPMPPVILLWSLFYEVAHELDLKPHSNYVVMILTGIAVFGCVGVVIMPYAAMAVLVQGIASGAVGGFLFDVALYLLANTSVAVLFLGVTILVFKFIIRPKFDFELKPKEPYKIQMTKEIKWVSLYFVLLFVGLIVPNLLPKEAFLYQIFVVKLGTTGVIMLITVLLVITRIDGKPLLDVGEALSKGISWELVFLMGSAMAISDYLVADGVGILPTIVAVISPLIAGKSAIAVTVIFIVIGLIMTNFINDVVTATVLYPIAAPFILEAGEV